MTKRTLNCYIMVSYMLGSELWESKFDGFLGLVKEYRIL